MADDKKLRGGKVGAALDFLEANIDKLPQEEQFQVKRFAADCEKFGGLREHQDLMNLFKLHDKHAKGQAAIPAGVHAQIAELKESNKKLEEMVKALLAKAAEPKAG